MSRSVPNANYFFIVHSNGKSSIDQVSQHLSDDDAAWNEATVIAAELFKDLDGAFRPDQEWSVEVSDGRRRPLYFIIISARNEEVSRLRYRLEAFRVRR